MHGKSLAGLSTFSRYKIEAANRYEYTISDSLSKLFDIDRCFSVSSLSVENAKTLYIINSHMSAYDKGGVIRQTQIQELNNFISKCYNEGNYVIVGGDFNHDLLTYNPDYNYTNENYVPTVSTFVEDYVVLGKQEDNHVINSFESLRNQNNLR